MCSLNYMHHGNGKTWYAIQPDKANEFEKIFTSYHKVDKLFDINVLLPMEVLQNNNIPIFKTVQLPGEFILTFGKTYHSGFSHGFNFSEAVNIAPSEWLNTYKIAIKDYSQFGYLKKTPFTLDWLLLEVYFNLRWSKFSYKTL